MEFGLYATVDGGAHWVKMRAVPTIQVRDVAIQKREGDLVAGTFGRGVYILDDYTALRDVTSQALGGAGAALPAARRLSVQRAEPDGSDLGRRGDSEPAVRRAAHLQHRAASRRRLEAGAQHRR